MSELILTASFECNRMELRGAPLASFVVLSTLCTCS